MKLCVTTVGSTAVERSYRPHSCLEIIVGLESGAVMQCSDQSAVKTNDTFNTSIIV